MKEFSYKITAILMSVVVLFSTMSFAVDMHFCGDTLMDAAVFYKAETCGMEIGNSASDTCSMTIKDCCSNEQILVDGQDELQLHVDKISFEQQVFIASFVYSYQNLFKNLDTIVPSYGEYKPPLVRKQIFKLDETYLI